MFTGIITDIGIIAKSDQEGDPRARITCGYDTGSIDLGASIASDGVCLTVVGLGADWYEVQVSAETVGKTNLSDWTAGRRVNLERALRVGDELGGRPDPGGGSAILRRGAAAGSTSAGVLHRRGGRGAARPD